MLTRFVAQARAIVRQAEAEAAQAGSSVIGAEHLLLAMTSEHGVEAREVLTSVGLDRNRIQSALNPDSAGATSPAGGQAALTGAPWHRARMASSGKMVLEHALKAAAGKSPIRPGHLLLGVLADVGGTVPKALTMAGVDTGDLAIRTRRALAGS